MTIQLSGDREQWVRSLVQGGHYASEDAVIDEALRLLQEREDTLTALRREIALGIDQADRGEVAPFDPHATLARIRSRQATSTGQTPATPPVNAGQPDPNPSLGLMRDNTELMDEIVADAYRHRREDTWREFDL